MMSDGFSMIFQGPMSPKMVDEFIKPGPTKPESVDFSSELEISVLPKLRSSVDKPQDGRDVTELPHGVGLSAPAFARHPEAPRCGMIPRYSKRFQDIRSQGHIILKVKHYSTFEVPHTKAMKGSYSCL